MTLQRRSLARITTLVATSLLVSAACAASGGSPAPSLSAVPAGASAPAAIATATAAPSAVPTASPITVVDGEPWIVYAWPRVATDGRWAIYLMRPDGSDAHEIAADAPGEHFAPTWSPDGQTVAFVVRDDDYPEGSIWTVPALGTGSTLVSGGGTVCPVGLFYPGYSPDGTKLAVVCYPDGDDHESVAVLDPASGSIRRLADFVHPEAVNSAPTWSPDGRTIAFEILHYDPTLDFLVGSTVATVPADGGEIDRLTKPDRYMVHPDWQPDGKAIVMNDLGPDAEPSNLFTIRPDGTGLRQLTHASVDGHMRIETPRWDSTGQQILVSLLYTTGDDYAFGGHVQLAVVDAAGHDPVVVSTETDGKYPELRPTP